MYEAIKELKTLEQEYLKKKYPSVPYLPFTNYKEKTANGLTRMIIDFIKFKGFQAERISVTGRPLDNTKVVTDYLGNKRMIGSVQWIPPSMQKGTADISATIKGRSVKIEIKIKDNQSEVQKEYQQQIEKAGGVYLLIRKFDQFYQWFNEFVK